MVQLSQMNKYNLILRVQILKITVLHDIFLRKLGSIKSDISCTNTHSWSIHAGISVTAKVNLFFASASATAELSIYLIIGKSYSSTKIFTWEEEENISCCSTTCWKVSYSAAIYQVESTT